MCVVNMFYYYRLVFAHISLSFFSILYSVDSDSGTKLSTSCGDVYSGLLPPLVIKASESPLPLFMAITITTTINTTTTIQENGWSVNTEGLL